MSSPDRESGDDRVIRNFAELLQELRVAQTGIQILFAFLLTIPFMNRFTTTIDGQRILYVMTLLAAASALVLLVGPVATHRLTFRRQLKERTLFISHVMTLAGLGLMALAVVGSVGLAVWMAVGRAWGLAGMAAVLAAILICWLLVPLRLRVRSA
jgi:hypothetical protein